jgi:3-dehydroquinate synthase
MTAKASTPKIKKVQVPLGSRTYQVVIGASAIDRLGILYKATHKRGVLLSDERLGPHRKRVLKNLKSSGWSILEIPLEAGEKLKDFEQIYSIYGKMLEFGLDRHSTLFALGGGTIGDAAGFIASTYLRGIAWVGLPTTLLAQVDSSVGGKTAVNHAQGKNLIGTFYQPALVICETEFLKTLSHREIISGFGEIIKYGLVYDKKLFQFIQENWLKAMALNELVICKLIAKSIQLKASAVSKDEYDRTGVREVLNFGHTFAHSLESLTQYKSFQHGEAVIWGMRFALALSKVKGRLKPAQWQEADIFLRTLPLPALPNRQPNEFFEPMSKDKKSQNGKVRFVLLKALGQAVLDRKVKASELLSALQILHDPNFSQKMALKSGESKNGK